MSDRSNIRSLKNYGIHGALALLIGVGIGSAVTFVLLILSPLSETTDTIQIPYNINPTTLIFTTLVFLIFGGYIGYIFESQKGFSRLVITGAIVGAICAIATGGLSELTETYGGLAICITIMGIAGLIFGFPKIRSMLILLASGIVGGTLCFGIFHSGYYVIISLLNIIGSFQLGKVPDILTLLAIIAVFAIMFGSILLAIGTPGALLAMGMYYSNRIVYTSKELPQYLKITRIIGISLVVVVLSISSISLVLILDQASTSTSVEIISDSENITLYIPVLIDNNGNVLEMYESPIITGSATVAVIDTKYGPALKIKGNSNEIKIKTTQEHGILQGGKTREKFIKGFSISMSNSSLYDNATHPLTVDVWVYSDNEIKDCNIRYYIDTKCGKDLLMSKYNFELRPEWQKVRLSGRNTYVD